MAAQDFPVRVPPDRCLSRRASGEYVGNSCCSCNSSSRKNSSSNSGNYRDVPRSICICSCRHRRTNATGVAHYGAFAESYQPPCGSSGAIPEAAAAPVAAIAATSALAADNAQSTPLEEIRLSALRNSLTCEAFGIGGSSWSTSVAVWRAVSATAAPPTAETTEVAEAAAVEKAEPQESREGGGGAAAAATDAPLRPMALARHWLCSSYHSTTFGNSSSNVNNCSNGSSNRNHGRGGCFCIRSIYNSSKRTGDSSSCCSSSRSRGISAVVHRLPLRRSHYAACSSIPAAASGASAASGREHQLTLHGLKHSDAREQQLLQQQQFQQGDDEDPKMLQIMRTHAFLHLTSGAVAGAVSRTATAPLDRVKVMLQLQPFSVPLRQAARVIMQQELSGNATMAAATRTAAVAAAAPYSSSNANGSSISGGRDKRSPQSTRAYGKVISQQLPQQQEARAAVPSASALTRITGSCCSNSNRSVSSRGHLLLGGWRGFFRGNLTNCLKVVPETAVKFYSYDICKHALAHRKQQQQQQQQPQQQAELIEPHLQLWDRFLCGATAGLCAQLLIYPMELVKTRLAAYGPGCMYTGVLQCFKAIYKEGGFRRLYRGVGPSLLGIIPYAGIDLAVFETLKEAYVKAVIIPKQRQQLEQQQQLLRATCSSCNPDTSSSGMVSFATGATAAAGAAVSAAAVSRGRCCCDESISSSGLPPASPPAAVLLLMGGFSSLIGQVLAYPTALVRTRMQVDGSGGQPLLYRSSAAVAAAAVRQGGLRGLYRGLQANCCKALPAVSLSWIVYEKMKYAISNFERDWTQKVEQQRVAARNRP